ncbi:hypothetical protein E6P09_00115 [Haloferax mediterranei ATCC 33500]|uniref:Uncharacterized protein n=1 Tax=Haloferax mediterranei (strain ATCC 33500 / DSM 1411 / JCM 8866 / NBRC 14739 / NCIMB 2177 / R-4) TaxID=523841 RepID=I3R6Y8_HALMT|nr:DUF5518 domain-containing protein [Haloferax mediterranei]AFK19998.1 hypothetical protein HFX_2311 [Haloferax mediterranei ATCC 33500]AHZ23377.1 hypothetical protein BM92_12335 [Haloferax mediterranei ATCC 33500]ELZ99545.1 hypothetical protein C439_13364 [Haloferax mediterranei ATCC 33500]MDX5987249.1 DUF5518 domain-containing protein [Haloferax mediterranei ATCC 33500]QCQ73771.1 hypothetical protein E6P09_00115 [Haloferax mediterranei ATCC 33500]
MTEWRPVLVGTCLAACTEALVYAMTGQFTLVGGVTGSALAGYVVGTDPADGGWHGLMAGVVWGSLLMPVSILLTFLNRTPILFPFQYLIPLFESPGELTTAIMLALALPNVATGMLGSLARRDAKGTWFDPAMAEVDAVEDA